MTDSSDEKYNLLLKQLDMAFMAIPFNRMLGLTLDPVHDAKISMRFVMKEELIGNFIHGILHGGVISSVLDMAGGVAVMKSIIDKHMQKPVEEIAYLLGHVSTIDLQINYLRKGKGEHFIAKAGLTKAGQKVNFAQMELYNQDGLLIATGSGTYLLG